MYIQVIKLSYPLFISGLFASAMGLVDTAIVGHLPSIESIAGVGVGGTVISLLGFLGFLRYSVSGAIGQAYAAQRYEHLKTLWIRCVMLSLCVGIISAMVTFLMSPVAVSIMGVQGMVAAESIVYMRVRLWEFPFAMFHYFMLGWFVGCGNTVSAMRVSILLVVLNVVFSYVYAIVLGMAVFGVALGTVQATVCVSVYNGWVLYRQYKAVFLSPVTQRIWRWQQGMRPLVTHGVQIVIRNIFLSLSLSLFMASLVPYGAVVLAASAIFIQILQMTADTLDSVADASTGLIAKSLGDKGGHTTIPQVVHATTIVAIVSSIVFGALIYFVSPIVFTLMTDKPSVIDTLLQIRFWLWICPIIIIWAFLYDGYFIGAGLIVHMRNAVIIAFVVYAIALYYITQIPIFENVHDALLVFFGVFYMARFLPLYIWRYKIYQMA